ncbi:MAG TPA: hypothetical protein VK663_03450 [Burkholderiales bacterium]|nr:hypothetical protein [Burkholderiales bacterium]
MDFAIDLARCLDGKTKRLYWRLGKIGYTSGAVENKKPARAGFYLAILG